MSENLNEQVEVTVSDAEVITVPIDDTLSNSGEAADAKAVGDALALKADKTELQAAITVNGQSADNQGAIIVTANETKMSSSDATTVKAKIEAVDAKTAADIPVSSETGAQTIAQALSSATGQTAEQIEMSASDTTTVKSAIDTVSGNLSTLSDTVTGIGNRTAADIRYQSGSTETIKQHVDGIDAGLVKSVNEYLPDEDGNIDLERVPMADNLFTEEAKKVVSSFLIRTTAGEGDVSDGNAWAQVLKGNRTHTGFTAEDITMTVNAMPRTAPAAITCSINQTDFKTAAGSAGTYLFNYTTGWDLNPASYGLTVSNDPVNGDKITVVWDGTNDATVTVNAVTRTAPAAITATIDRDTWVSVVSTSGTTTFTYTTSWSADPASYGITVTNTPIAGDQIVVVYVKEIRGTITVAMDADPDGNTLAIVGTGWNLYDHTKGYARVTKYSTQYGYAISGTYTSIAFATTPTGTTSTINTDANGLFTVPSDGYVIVTGGNGTNTAIWATWSDWTEGYSGSWEAYKESKVDITTIMSTYFPYGLMRVGDVRDEIDFVHKQAISRVSRAAYSDENRAAAEASGRAYEYDENYIYQVRASEVVDSITIDEEYTVSEHGLEYLAGSSIAAYTEVLYSANLKDKLKRDVLTISPQTLTTAQKTQARANINAAKESEVASLENGLAIVVDGKKTAYSSGAAVGDYVFVKNSTITDITDGLYKAAKAIPYNTAVDKTYFTACAKGLGGQVASLNDQVASFGNIKFLSSSNTVSSFTLSVPSYSTHFIFMGTNGANSYCILLINATSSGVGVTEIHKGSEITVSSSGLDVTIALSTSRTPAIFDLATRGNNVSIS